MRTVDTREYLSILRQLTEEGRDVSLRITGSSMAPFLIHQRDTVYFRKPDRPLKKGDMVFYQRDSGQFVMHRICRVKKDGYYPDRGAHPQRSDFRPHISGVPKGKNNGPRGFLVGIFPACLAAADSLSECAGEAGGGLEAVAALKQERKMQYDRHSHPYFAGAGRRRPGYL